MNRAPVWMAIVAAMVGGLLLTVAGDKITPEPVPAVVKPGAPVDVVIRQADTPGDATVKANVAYLQAQAKMFRELKEKAATFPDSGAAADWMAQTSERGHTEAFRGWHGYLFTFFGEGKAYDPDSVRKWAEEMAVGCDKAVDALGAVLQH